MDYGDTPEEAAFRAELRAWIRTELPFPAIPEDDQAKVDLLTGFQRRMFDAGYAAISFPREYGGQGLPPVYEAIFLDELGSAGLP